MEDRHPATVTGPITDAERTYALDLLTRSRDDLRATMADLSAAQQQYKPDPSRWSITECTEHIALVDRGMFRTVQKSMALPADPARRADIQVSDVLVIKAVRSRNNPVAAPDPFVPTGQYADVSSAMAAFEQQRADAITFVETTTADFRTHYFSHPFLGTLDDYQAILAIASHVERHRKQIEAIKADPNFPR